MSNDGEQMYFKVAAPNPGSYLETILMLPSDYWMIWGGSTYDKNSATIDSKSIEKNLFYIAIMVYGGFAEVNHIYTKDLYTLDAPIDCDLALGALCEQVNLSVNYYAEWMSTSLCEQIVELYEHQQSLHSGLEGDLWLAKILKDNEISTITNPKKIPLLHFKTVDYLEHCKHGNDARFNVGINKQSEVEVIGQVVSVNSSCTQPDGLYALVDNVFILDERFGVQGELRYGVVINSQEYVFKAASWAIKYQMQ
ncbi:hypothetical protein [Actinomyces vulturis]|uniref:hypothetical protein n=1 Tax=Actinomyces vulturis TaxID=1857645 RepID=UPI0008311053|nr:hypothetical protein [Actinomyces vulturis]